MLYELDSGGCVLLEADRGVKLEVGNLAGNFLEIPSRAVKPVPELDPGGPGAFDLRVALFLNLFLALIQFD